MTYNDILSFIGFYFIVIGTWRLANATQPAPVGGPWQQTEEDRTYKPFRDIFSPHLVVLWIGRTIKTFKENGSLNSAVILQRQFSWGLLWLLLGIVIQYVSSIL